MAVFRKKPVEVEAVQFGGLDGDEIRLIDGLPPEWLRKAFALGPHEVGSVHAVDHGHRGRALYIVTLEGALTVSPMDWIIRGTKGELYPVKPAIFEQIYEAI